MRFFRWRHPVQSLVGWTNGFMITFDITSKDDKATYASHTEPSVLRPGGNYNEE